MHKKLGRRCALHARYLETQLCVPGPHPDIIGPAWWDRILGLLVDTMAHQSGSSNQETHHWKRPNKRRHMVEVCIHTLLDTLLKALHQLPRLAFAPDAHVHPLV